MDNNTVRVFRNFYCSVRTAYEASQEVTNDALSIINSYTFCFTKIWKSFSPLLAKELYESQNFQMLNNNMTFLMSGKATLISFGAALTEIHDYTTKLAEEFDLLGVNDV